MKVVSGIQVIARCSSAMDILLLASNSDLLAIDIAGNWEGTLVLSGPCSPALMDGLTTLLIFG